MRTVLLAARSAVALYRLLDVLPVFAGDHRITRLFTLVPGSDFGVAALAAIDAAGARTVPWDEACAGSYDLILLASPKGEWELLHGDRVLLPHGAGFGKTIRAEGSADSASGLDPEYLLPADRTGGALISLHALAHPSQVARLAAVSPRAAARAEVVGDPTVERVLASLSLRDDYRAALGTGSRRLIVLASTWGEESLLSRRPGLPAELAARPDRLGNRPFIPFESQGFPRSRSYGTRCAPALPFIPSSLLAFRSPVPPATKALNQEITRKTRT